MTLIWFLLWKCNVWPLTFMWGRLSFNESLDSQPQWLINGSCEIMVKLYVIKIESFLQNELLLRKPPMMTHDPLSSWALEEATNKKQRVHVIMQNQKQLTNSWLLTKQKNFECKCFNQVTSHHITHTWKLSLQQNTSKLWPKSSTDIPQDHTQLLTG